MEARAGMLAQLFERSMGLGAEWEVSDVWFEEKGDAPSELHIRVAHVRGRAVECPECGRRCGVYDTRERTWRHLDIWQYETIVHCAVPRADCPEHGVRTVVFDSLELADLSIEKFRVWARKTCGFVHGHADHPAIGPTCRCFGLRREEGQRGMIGVDKIEDIRRRGRRGEAVASIARETGVSEPTVRKYLRMDDLSPSRPEARVPESELLAPYAPRIDAWLDDDCRNWRKQRHTATRVYVRLRDELGYGGSYSTVQRYVKRRREEMAEERDRRDAQGYLQLEWLPGECQVDFGEADFRVRGVVTRGRYLTVTFPHSNVGLTQVFWGETSECVCQGLRNVFEFVGGVPRRAVFDNATEVGRRVGPEVRLSELFRRFSAHYGLDYTFTNPYSGNEKGNVENKVGCHRRNLFVPVPSFHDVRAFNGRLLGDCLDLSAGKRHYRLGTPELELFGEDRAALSPLPEAPFSCVRWETRRCSKQGTFTLGGVHRYSAGPAYARREVAVALGAFDVTVCDCGTGEVVAAYDREWGEAPTDSSDPTLQLRLLCMRPAGWRDSSVRASLPAELVSFLDGEPADRLHADLRVLRDESSERGWAAAVEGMLRAVRATGSIDRATVAVSAARAQAGDERVEYDELVDLGVYDRALRVLEGGEGNADDQLGA